MSGGGSGSCDAFLGILTCQQLAWSRVRLVCRFIFRISASGVRGIYLTSVQPITDPHNHSTLHSRVWLRGRSPHATAGVGKVRTLWGGMCSHVTRRHGNPKKCSWGVHIWGERQGHRRWAAVTCCADPSGPLSHVNSCGCTTEWMTGIFMAAPPWLNTCEQLNSFLLLYILKHNYINRHLDKHRTTYVVRDSREKSFLLFRWKLHLCLCFIFFPHNGLLEKWNSILITLHVVT